MSKRPNLICIVSDTLRIDYLGCYGNGRIHTPNLDEFAEESAIFDSAYPESLPTIPVRRALHTGRRAYPFRNYEPLKWDIVYLPGWQPMDNDEDTLAENLVESGYYTGFVTDVLPYFAPGMNFTRGFWQWHFVRGQQQDRWRSPATVTRDDLTKYGDADEILRGFPSNLVLRHVANTAHIQSEEETTTAQVFRWAMDFIEDNRRVQPFYLMVDLFDPHEPWEAPDSYLEMYADPNYNKRTIVHVRYGPMKGQMDLDELEHIKAHYSGLVTLVDTWFGYFVDKLKRLGLWENSVVAFISDHGTNFADNPGGIVGKPHYALYPGVMRIPLIIRFPNGLGAGKHFGELVYDLDVTATFYELVGIENSLSIHGQSLLRLVGDGSWEERESLTSRYGDTVWYRDKDWWVIMNVEGKALGVFDLREDPDCQRNLVGRGDDIKEVSEMAWRKILDDAGGELPIYQIKRRTDAIGQRDK